MENGTGAVPGGGAGRYSVPQAARLLGISERAVRKRIVAGTLPAERTAQGWLVDLEAVPAEPAAVPGAALGGTVAVLEAVPAAQATDGELHALRDALAHAHEEVVFLRAQLVARDAELQRRDDEIARGQQLLLAALASRPALEPHAPPSTAGTAPHEAVPVPRRPWWHRLWPWRHAPHGR